MDFSGKPQKNGSFLSGRATKPRGGGGAKGLSINNRLVTQEIVKINIVDKLKLIDV